MVQCLQDNLFILKMSSIIIISKCTLNEPYKISKPACFSGCVKFRLKGAADWSIIAAPQSNCPLWNRVTVFRVIFDPCFFSSPFYSLANSFAPSYINLPRHSCMIDTLSD